MKLIIVYSILVLLLGGCVTQRAITRVSINGKMVKVKVMKTQEQRFRGLSNRKRLAADRGMLFVFPDYDVRSFWMKQMRFPLDIIWINDNHIVGIEHSVSTTTPLISYRSPTTVNYVLEVNAGWSKTNGISTSDRVEFK